MAVLDPDDYIGLGRYLLDHHMEKEAAEAYQEAFEKATNRVSMANSSEWIVNYDYDHGRQDDALKIAKELETRPDLKSSADASIALIYVGLGDMDQAMSWLNKAYDARFNPSILIRPAFDPLRSDARFQELKRRMGLPP